MTPGKFIAGQFKDWCYKGNFAKLNFSSFWCDSGQNVVIIKHQKTGVLVTSREAVLCSNR